LVNFVKHIAGIGQIHLFIIIDVIYFDVDTFAEKKDFRSFFKKIK
jgi:hypothetical protein